MFLVLACSVRGVEPDTWESLPDVPFEYGVSAGGGLATDGTYVYAADFSGDGNSDYIDLDEEIDDDPEERFDALGIANGSVRFARFDPATATWEMLPVLNAGGVGGDSFSHGNFNNPLFVAAGKLYYYQMRSGPNIRALYSYDLSDGRSGTWTTVWEKTGADSPGLTSNSGLVGLEHEGNPVIIHHEGNGQYRIHRTTDIAGGGVHEELTPHWGFTGAHFPNNGGWAYDRFNDQLFHLSGNQLLSWTHNDAAYPGGSLAGSVPNGTDNLCVQNTLIQSLKTTLGWGSEYGESDPGVSLWGNSLTVVNDPTGEPTGPGGEDNGDRVLYFIRGETSADTWTFNGTRGLVTNGDFARYFLKTGSSEDLPDAPFNTGKGSCTVYLDGAIYTTQGDTLTVADDPGSGNPMNTEGIRLPGKGFARFVLRTGPPPAPVVQSMSPSGALDYTVASVRLTFSREMDLASLRAPGAITLTDPQGAAVPILEVTPSADPRAYTVSFDKLPASGTYSLKVEATATDLAGRPLNQDGDDELGEVKQDRFTGTLSITLAPPGDPLPGPLLHVPFDGNPTGAAGETPDVTGGVSYAAGVFDQASVLAASGEVRYPATGNISATEGSVCFWIKPGWTTHDDQKKLEIRWGNTSGMVFGVYGEFVRVILNQYLNEQGTGQRADGAWADGLWHHLAFVWSDARIAIYLDGTVLGEVVPTHPLADEPVAGEQIRLEATAEVSVDDFRTYGQPLSGAQIGWLFASGRGIVDFEIDPDHNVIDEAAGEISLLETWYNVPRLKVTGEGGSEYYLNGSVAAWVSSNESSVTVDGDARISAAAAGDATLTATLEGMSRDLLVHVVEPVLQAETEQVPAELATPIPDAHWEMPVVIVQYLPTQDGLRLDQELTGRNDLLGDMRDRTMLFNRRAKFMLEEGTIFRGYKRPQGKPALGYRVMAIYTFYEPFMKGKKVGWKTDVYRPDYKHILSRIDAEEWVNRHAVQEFWVWGWHYGDIEPAESNMSSPLTGDVSNSERYQDDLPIFDRTFVLYNYNFDRSENEAVHNHTHQLERMYDYIAKRQDGNAALFWQKWCGGGGGYAWSPGRCGNAHYPPNGTADYDYWNTTFVDSDCEDWLPEGGPTKPVNCNTWLNYPYVWPEGTQPAQHPRTEAHFYISWMQNMPGRDSAIPYEADKQITNWWNIVGDWDHAILTGMGLHAPAAEMPGYTLNVGAIGQGTTVPRSGPHTFFASTGAVEIRAIPDADREFAGWETTGGAAVADPAAEETTIELTGDGTLTARFRTPSLKVVQVRPVGVVTEPVDHIDITFNMPVDIASLTAPGAVILNGPLGLVPLGEPAETRSEATYRFPVSPLHLNGDFLLTVNPAVTWGGGTPLDQNDNGTPGEDGDDFSSTFTLDLPVPDVDLVYYQDSLHRPPAAVSPGESFLVYWRERNEGGEATTAAWSAMVYLSVDEDLSPDDPLLGMLPVDTSLAAGQQEDRQLEVVVPDGLEYGRRYLVVVVNGSSGHGETDIANNTGTIPVEIGPAPAFPDWLTRGIFPGEMWYWAPLGDMNGDGILDWVQPTNVGDRVPFGLGDGTWLGEQAGLGYSRYRASQDWYSASMAAPVDFDGDGNLDRIALEYAGSGRHWVDFWKGDGRGGFPIRTALALSSSSASAIRAGDFNGDGLPDLAMLMTGSATVQLLLNDGMGGVDSGGFTTGSDFRVVQGLYGEKDGILLWRNEVFSFVEWTPDRGLDIDSVNAGERVYKAVTGDWNGDDVIDVATIEYETFGEHFIQVYLGIGGGYVEAQTIALPLPPWDFAATHLDDDGLTDLAVVCSDSMTQDEHGKVLLSNGDGTFSERVESYEIKVRAPFETADVNSDGLDDLVAANPILADGDGGLRAARQVLLGTAAGAMAAGDLNADGREDVVVALPETGQVAVLVSGDRFGNAATHITDLGGTPADLAVCELTGDDSPDILIADSANGRLMVLPGNGDGTFGAPGYADIPGTPVQLTTGHWNADGNLDVAAIGAPEEAALHILLGDGAGGLTLAGTLATGAQPIDVVHGDVDGDGAEDLAVLRTPPGQRRVETYLGDGAGGFPAGSETEIGWESTASIAAGDLNQDGLCDIAVSSAGILLSNGDGSFRTQPFGIVGPTAAEIGGTLVDDLNDDGYLDVAVTNQRSFSGEGMVLDDAVAIAYGDGRGGVLGAAVAAAGYEPVSICAADIDGDGALDLAVASKQGRRVTILPNLRPIRHTPAGAAGQQPSEVLVRFPEDMETADFGPPGEVTIVGPAGEEAPEYVEFRGQRTLAVGLNPVSLPGLYRVRVGPDFFDDGGVPMNVDGDDTPGQPEDAYLAAFTTAETVWTGAGHIRWRGLIVQPGTVTVPAGQKLIIEAGTIVAFPRNASLIVHGELICDGTPQNPVVLTSTTDPVAGPAAREDPEPGDWAGVRVRGGTADIHHSRIRYGGNRDELSHDGLVHVRDGGYARINACAIEHCIFSGLMLWSRGTVADVTNTVIRDCDFGVLADWYTVLNLTNCTLDDNRVGVRGHGGAYNITNTIVSNSLENGVDNTQHPTVMNIAYTNVWSTQGQDYGDWPDQTGQNGNVSIDPEYRDYQAGVLSLDYLSPMIDAADGNAAPEKDYFDSPRYDDPRVENTGVPDAEGAVPDLGAYEFVEQPCTGVDLVVTDFHAPSEAVAGQVVTVEWTVENVGDVVVPGLWTDKIAVTYGTQRVTVLDGGPEPDLLLAPGESVRLAADAVFPGTEDGLYEWQITVNAKGDIPEGCAAANNMYSPGSTVSVDVPELVVGDPASPGCFHGDAPVWFKVHADQDGLIQVVADVAAPGGKVEVFVGHSRVPTRADYDYRSPQWGSPKARASFHAKENHEYYVMVCPAGPESTGSDFTVVAKHPLPNLLSVTPNTAANSGAVTVTVRGEGLDDEITWQLENGRGVLAPSAVMYPNPETALITFDLGGAPAADYALRAALGPEAAVLPGALTILEAGALAPTGEALDLTVSLPARIRGGRTVPFVVEYRNTGLVDMALPMIALEADEGVRLAYLERDTAGDRSLTFRATAIHPGFGVLPPGAVGTCTVYCTAPSTLASIEISAYAASSSETAFGSQTLDWSEFYERVRPDGVSDADWQTFMERDGSRYGSTVGDMCEYLSELAAGLPSETLLNGTFVEGRWLWQDILAPAGPPIYEPLETFSFDESDDGVVRGTPAAPDRASGQSTAAAVGQRGGDGICDVFAVSVGAPFRDIPNTVVDAQSVAGFLKAVYNVPEENVQLVTGPVGPAEVIAAFARAKAAADGDDILIFWNNSHGSHYSVEQEGGKRLYGKIRLLGGDMTVDDVNLMLAGAPCPVLFVNDSCYSDRISDDVAAIPSVSVAGCAWGQLARDGWLTPTAISQILLDPEGDWVKSFAAAAERVGRSWGGDRLQVCAKWVPREGGGSTCVKYAWIPLDFSLIPVWDIWKIHSGRNEFWEERVPPDAKKYFLDLLEEWARWRQFPQIHTLGTETLVISRPEPKEEAAEEVRKMLSREPRKARARSTVVSSHDPNEKIGPTGYGDKQCVGSPETLAYVIHFENDPRKATAPAQRVVVTDRLPENTDPATFEFKSVGFNGALVRIPPGRRFYTAVDYVDTDPNPVRVTAAFEPVTRTLTWTLESFDVNTESLPEDPLAGFLPPNLAPPEGEGFVSYTVRTVSDLPSSTQVPGTAASIVFDDNNPISTNGTLHTVDAEAPVSLIRGVRKTGTGCDVLLEFEGEDELSGIAFFDVFTGGVGERSQWTTVIAPSALYEGTWGEVQSFFVRARDTIGNAEAIPETASATVRIPPWAMRFAVDSEVGTELFVGLDDTGSTGWDANLDEDVLTVRAATAWLAGPPGHELLRYDVKPNADTVTWTLHIDEVDGSRQESTEVGRQPRNPAVLSWDPAAVPDGRHMWLVALDGEGAPLGDTYVDLTGGGSADVSGYDDWQIVLSDDPPVVLPLSPGWNLVSLPVSPVDPSPMAVFGQRALPKIWSWGSAGRGGEAFEEATTLTAGRGYWVFSPEGGAIMLAGSGFTGRTATLDQGWNLIGIGQECSAVLPGVAQPAWWWGARGDEVCFLPTDVLRPGFGYWIFWDGADGAEVEFPLPGD